MNYWKPDLLWLSMMREINYQKFSERLHGKVGSEAKRIPANVTLELTYRCNNSCVHCYCNLPHDDKTSRDRELSTKEIISLLKQLKELGSLWLLLSGGEVLLRPDFKEIYMAAKQNGFLISIFTNATLVEQSIIELFVKYPPFVVEVTMYGATRNTYEKVTRLPESYDLYRQGLQLLLDAGVSVKLKTMALTANQHEIKAMEKEAKQLGCHFRFDPLVHKRIDNHTNSFPDKCRLSAREVAELEMQFPGRMEEHREYCERTAGVTIPAKYLLSCGAGKFSMHITPDGHVAPCSMLLNLGISLKDKDISDIWNQDFAVYRKEKKSFSLTCDHCTIQSLCSQCPGWSLIERGAFESKVDYLCEIAKSRARSFPFITDGE